MRSDPLRSGRFRVPSTVRRWAQALAVGLLALAMLSVAHAQEPTSGNEAAQVPGQRVFVTGHSFHAWIGGPLAEIARSAGIEDHKDAGRQSLGGSKVTQHWNLPDERNKAKQAIRNGEVDVLTMSPHFTPPEEGIDRFTELLLEHNPQGRVYVQASWYIWDLPGNSNRNFKNADRDSISASELREGYQPFYEALTKQVRGLNERFRDEHKRQVAFVVPVGHAVYNLRERVAAGKVPGVTRQSDLFRDAIGHPHPPVAALAAYCYYAAVYRRSPVGLPMPKILADAKTPGWNEDLNRILQEVAWEAVSNEPLAGVNDSADSAADLK